MSLDPIHDAWPQGRLPGHAGEHDERLCPVCAAPLDFLHYDHTEIPLHGGLYSSTELAILVGMTSLGVVAIFALGMIPGIAVLVLTVPLAMRWQRKQEVDAAVWRCSPCDKYFTGTPLRRWKAH